ncbi:hypothetical protein [Actinomadura formosensis]|uniref:hypothetical protein n=1 Tax=Actinomadura formosensis TaxID=60706 RepID=UPI003D8C119F
MDVFNPHEMHLLVLLALGFGRALLQRLTVVVALALVLRDSTPDERPVLLNSFAECLRFMPPSGLRAWRRHERRNGRRK